MSDAEAKPVEPAPAAPAPEAAPPPAEAPKPAEEPPAAAPAAAPPAEQPAAAAAAAPAAAPPAVPPGPAAPPVDEVLHKKFRAVFSLFELESKTMRNMCDERELATLVRSLGYNPTQAHLRELLVDIRGDEQPTGYISFDRFERALIRLLESHRRELVRDTEDKIIAAFRTLDPEGKGYLDPEYVKELLMSRGDQFKSDEMQAMLEAAMDPVTNRIYYEDYAAMLADDQAVIPDTSPAAAAS